MEKIFEILNNSQRANQIALDSVGRIPHSTLAIVTNNNDPENKRRVKVSSSSNPSTESDWLIRILPYPNIDPPLPEIGQTVHVDYIDGLETKGCYRTVMNDTNPSKDKKSAVNDHHESTPGNKDESIGGDHTVSIKGDRNETINGLWSLRADDYIQIECGSLLSLRTDSGASITLTSAGYVIIEDAQGRQIRLGGAGGFNTTWDLNNSPLNIINASSMTINSKEIATVGAHTNNYIVVDRGWN